MALSLAPSVAPPSRLRLASRPRRCGVAALRVSASSAAPLTPAAGPVLVAGASGGVGQLVVASLLDRGFSVRALVRTAARGDALFADAADARASGRLQLVPVDLRDASALAASGACAGLAAAVCATGTTAFPSGRWAGGNGPKETDCDAVRNLVSAVAQSSPDLRRFVLVSSVGVTRTGSMPYIILNLFGVLTNKALGEAALRASGLPWAVLRPGRLTDGPYTSYDLNTLLRATSKERRGVQLATGDTLSPQESSRIVVAEAAVQALSSPAALGREFDVGSFEGDGPGADAAAWDKLFADAKPAATA